MKTFGIYSITNTVTGRVYVGQVGPYKRKGIDDSFTVRWGEHIRMLRKGTHPNVYLARSAAKYGTDVFDFAILEVVDDPSTLTAREQWYYERYRMMPAGVYNLKNPEPALNRGAKLSDETRLKMSISARFRTNAPAHLAIVSANSKKMWAARGANWHPSDETRAKQSAAKKGKPAVNKNWPLIARRPIERICARTGLVKEYDTVGDVQADGFGLSAVIDAANGRYGTYCKDPKKDPYLYRGCYWQYIGPRVYV